jgi:uncharacterized protein YyaL (SSP411 family)
VTNRLAQETSPYLQEHADNPVDWYAWGPEALQRAREEDRPILLSIGYSACHWCHVMARESFEDPETAAIMNRHFVNIKVDREERPDLDQIYMRALQGMTGSGGWPMTMFLLPDGTPFFGGTYFPPADRHGMPGFRRVLLAVAEAHALRRGELQSTAGRVREFLERGLAAEAARAPLTPMLLDQAYEHLARDFDAAHGGFGGAPKFPQPMLIDILLRTHHRTGAGAALRMATQTLDAMAQGGIYDQLGGGFHRYAVDAVWLVPHFEKMLYDNALLARAYLDAWQVTGQASYRRVVEETIAFALREMLTPEGGFASSLDADSDGEEGKFYVWTLAEVESVLGKEARPFCQAFDVTDQGNWEGRSILHAVRPDAAERMAAVRDRLLPAREERWRPHRDDKVLSSWNGLMLRTLAEAARALHRDDWLERAETQARFLLAELRRGDRMQRSYKDGRAPLAGYLEDQAAVADGLLALYEASFAPQWLEGVRSLCAGMVSHFWDERSGAFFDTASDQEALVVRPQDVTDNAVPSGTSMAADVLLRGGALLDMPAWQSIARQVLERLGSLAASAPQGFGRLLAVVDFEVSRPVELAFAGRVSDPTLQALLEVARRRYLPNRLLALAEDGRAPDLPLLRGRHQRDGRAAAFLCEGFQCQAPTSDPEELSRQLDRVAAASSLREP